MIRKVFFCSLWFIVLTFLIFKEKGTSESNSNGVVKNTVTTKLTKLVDTALSYNGTTYKFGGTNSNGLDCSGLVYISFKEVGIKLPRSSKNMYHKGEVVDLDDVEKGDLLFFDTDNFKDKVTHVGLVTSANDLVINFIHSSTSRGVIISSLDEEYWENAFVGAKRIIK